MKIQILGVSILALSMFSCQPKDEKLSRPGSGGVGLSSKSISPADYNNLIAISFDRVGESLALVKAALSPAYADVNQLTVEGVQGRDIVNTDSQLVVKNKDKSVLKSNDSAKSETRYNHIVESLIKDENGKVLRVILRADESTKIENRGYKIQGKKQPFFKSITMNDRSEVSKLSDDTYLLTIIKTEEVSPSQFETSYLNSQIQIKFAWDGSLAGLDQEIKILGVSLNARSHNLKTGAVSLKGSGDLSLRITDQCVSLSGQINLVKKDQENGTIVDINDSTISISAQNYQSVAQPCESRPYVDLTRLF